MTSLSPWPVHWPTPVTTMSWVGHNVRVTQAEGRVFEGTLLHLDPITSTVILTEEITKNYVVVMRVSNLEKITELGETKTKTTSTQS